jgi:hypothetical protein
LRNALGLVLMVFTCIAQTLALSFLADIMSPVTIAWETESHHLRVE